MKLYIAEKPCLGKAIAQALPKPHHKADGCIYVGHSDKRRCDVVSWCIGHLLEQLEPDAYDASLKKWSHETLPILPDRFPRGWQLAPKKQTRKQYSILKKLVKQADHIIHCGDPDREGQLLVDELIHHVGVKASVKDSIERCLISDLNLPAVKQALASLKSNKDFVPLSVSALARSRADWLYGMNLTRAFTLQAQKVGFQGLVSIGRVQTPLLGLIVRRDAEVEAFVVRDYYEVDAHIQISEQQVLSARWQPSEACEPYQDSEGRVINKALAENVVARIKGQPANVEATSAKSKKQVAPLPYNLSALQIDAAKAFGMSAKTVLDTCQNLYERHKLITYPRSDNRYLPSGHLSQSAQIFDAIASNTNLQNICNSADSSLKGRVWNDAKVGAHHAIIPTANKSKKGLLSKAEQQVYELIAKHYLIQFFPAWAYTDREISFRIAGGLFRAKSRETSEPGWKQVLKSTKDEKQTVALPQLKKGERFTCLFGDLLSKLTQPPKHFSDASLLAAMTGIARFVSDPEIKKILKDTDGLGTEATRASIIELLFKRQFIYREGKAIKATEAGRKVIASLPEEVSLPDMTAHWELMLKQMSQGEYAYADFMLPLEQQISHLLCRAKDTHLSALAGLKAQNKFKKRKYKARRKKASPTLKVGA
ncbi:DNA topoisomerase III [Oleiphilus sp. HI0069]|jgi:DNA topoisomerase-3|uniref:DNA topoisomerase III n=4 Tax=Oleiphilus TaxID=141450 RepID=UPI0007C2A42A|nr:MULTISPECIES: DNA topoisomerase III [unclassified Oleiphilus]KZY66199.1 DNA topoisomerase III [Oleiphilus sp. HI0061]KZY80000.1 DNA topoisomerase III [Oleiphilus sp. HI0069]KZZ74623.1 DNA topoisomerase III [Oleiphilus sp. HI0132]